MGPDIASLSHSIRPNSFPKVIVETRRRAVRPDEIELVCRNYQFFGRDYQARGNDCIRSMGRVAARPGALRLLLKSWFLLGPPAHAYLGDHTRGGSWHVVK
jgi:hypothetical protein